jgi:transposase
MSSQRYSPEFKEEAARQIVDRGYSVADVSKRLGVSAHSLYKWVKAIKPDKTEEPLFCAMADRLMITALPQRSVDG